MRTLLHPILLTAHHSTLLTRLLGTLLRTLPCTLLRTLPRTLLPILLSAILFLQAAEAVPPSLLMKDSFMEDTRSAIELLYNREFEASLHHLDTWKQSYPDHPLWALWNALDAWWPVLIDLENTTYDDAFLTAAEKVVLICDEMLKTDPDHLDALIIRSVINGQISRYYSNRYRWYRSFLSGRRALRDFFRIEKSHPHLPDLNFGIGMYRYYTAFLVEEYALARSLRWMLPSGDRQEGLSRLKEAADSSIFMEPEATYFLGHIYLHFENQPGQALEYLSDLYHRYPANSFYRRLYIRSLYDLRRRDEALRAIRESLDHPMNAGPHETMTMREDLLTIKGLIHYEQQAFDSATSAFLQALQYAEKLHPFAKRRNLITTLYFLGELSIRDGQRDLAQLYFRRAATPDIDHIHNRKAREALRKYRLE